MFHPMRSFEHSMVTVAISSSLGCMSPIKAYDADRDSCGVDDGQFAYSRSSWYDSPEGQHLMLIDADCIAVVTDAAAIRWDTFPKGPPRAFSIADAGPQVLVAGIAASLIADLGTIRNARSKMGAGPISRGLSAFGERYGGDQPLGAWLWELLRDDVRATERIVDQGASDLAQAAYSDGSMYLPVFEADAAFDVYGGAAFEWEPVLAATLIAHELGHAAGAVHFECPNGKIGCDRGDEGSVALSMLVLDEVLANHHFGAEYCGLYVGVVSEACNTILRRGRVAQCRWLDEWYSGEGHGQPLAEACRASSVLPWSAR